MAEDQQTPPRVHYLGRHICLVGLMGVGKTTIGRRLAKRLGRPFYDSDDEIEKASGRTVAGYFRDHGEADFRDGEYRVIRRLLNLDQPIILATGGGAFIHEPTRDFIKENAMSIWLRGDLDTLVERVKRNNKRPLLRGVDPAVKMAELMAARDPLYSLAEKQVDIARGPHMRTVNRVMKAVDDRPRRRRGRKPNSAMKKPAS